MGSLQAQHRSRNATQESRPRTGAPGAHLVLYPTVANLAPKLQDNVPFALLSLYLRQKGSLPVATTAGNVVGLTAEGSTALSLTQGPQ